jgi:hypothetical protein
MDDTARGARSIKQLEHFRFDRFTLDLTRGSLQLGLFPRLRFERPIPMFPRPHAASSAFG